MSDRRGLSPPHPPSSSSDRDYAGFRPKRDARGRDKSGSCDKRPGPQAQQLHDSVREYSDRPSRRGDQFGPSRPQEEDLLRRDRPLPPPNRTPHAFRRSSSPVGRSNYIRQDKAMPFERRGNFDAPVRGRQALPPAPPGPPRNYPPHQTGPRHPESQHRDTVPNGPRQLDFDDYHRPPPAGAIADGPRIPRQSRYDEHKHYDNRQRPQDHGPPQNGYHQERQVPMHGQGGRRGPPLPPQAPPFPTKRAPLLSQSPRDVTDGWERALRDEQRPGRQLPPSQPRRNEEDLFDRTPRRDNARGAVRGPIHDPIREQQSSREAFSRPAARAPHANQRQPPWQRQQDFRNRDQQYDASLRRDEPVSRITSHAHRVQDQSPAPSRPRRWSHSSKGSSDTGERQSFKQQHGQSEQARNNKSRSPNAVPRKPRPASNSRSPNATKRKQQPVPWPSGVPLPPPVVPIPDPELDREVKDKIKSHGQNGSKVFEEGNWVKQKLKEVEAKKVTISKRSPSPASSTPAKRPRVEEPEARIESQNTSAVGTPRSGFSKSAFADGAVYERIGQVGEGTYGKVYKAKHRATGDIVALKRIRMEQERDGFPITSMREIKLLQRLRHPGVVTLLEMMIEKGSVYVVFEYMEHDLTGLLANPQIDFSPANIKDLSQQFFSGLAYLHSQGVLHRDLKASNILLNNAGELKLADFGLARFFHKNPAKAADYTNRVITLWFRPPELLLGATAYGASVDIWSAGCIFVELFTKTAPFPGKDEIHQLELIYQHMGTATRASWPGVEALPWFELVKPGQFPEGKFKERFADQLSPAALHLAESILVLDPAKRPTAQALLEHDYFRQEQPAPDRRTLIDISESHEWDSKQKKRDERKKSQQGKLQAQQASQSQRQKSKATSKQQQPVVSSGSRGSGGQSAGTAPPSTSDWDPGERDSTGRASA